MFETLKRLYEQGRLDSVGLENAVGKGWITALQMEEISVTGGTTL